jgi:hypothetical protein
MSNREPIEAIGKVSSKPSSSRWDALNHLDPDLDSWAMIPSPPKSEKIPSVPAADTLTSIAQPADTVKAAEPTTYDNIVSLGKNVWSYIYSCLPFGTSAGTHSTSPIGIPAIEEISQEDMRAFQKLLKELSDISEKMKASEAEEQKEEDAAANMRKKMALEKLIWQAFKEQHQIRKEGMEAETTKLILDQQQQKEVNKEFRDIRVDRDEAASNFSYWQNIHNYTNGAAIAAAAVTFGMTVYTGGAAAPLLPGMISGLTTASSAISGIVKTRMQSKTEDFLGKMEILKTRRMEVQAKTQDGLEQTRKNLDKTFQIFEWEKSFLESQDRAMKAMINR